MLSEEITQRIPVAREDDERGIPRVPESRMKFRRMRRHDVITGDFDFYFQLSRLIGMAEMLTTYMKIHGDEQAQAMANRAEQSLSFFYEDK
jgi:hypothetical protein